jgi:hypothetical protein
MQSSIYIIGSRDHLGCFLLNHATVLGKNTKL